MVHVSIPSSNVYLWEITNVLEAKQCMINQELRFVDLKNIFLYNRRLVKSYYSAAILTKRAIQAKVRILWLLYGIFKHIIHVYGDQTEQNLNNFVFLDQQHTFSEMACTRATWGLRHELSRQFKLTFQMMNIRKVWKYERSREKLQSEGQTIQCQREKNEKKTNIGRHSTTQKAKD